MQKWEFAVKKNAACYNLYCRTNKALELGFHEALHAIVICFTAESR